MVKLHEILYTQEPLIPAHLQGSDEFQRISRTNVDVHAVKKACDFYDFSAVGNGRIA